MLLSTLQERERRFKIALRAGIPALMFIGVILYIVFARDVNINISIRESLIMAGIVFTTIYFIYFMLELATKGTLVDNETDGFTPNAFIEAVRKYKPNTMSILAIKNLNIINNNYGTKATNKLLQNLIQSLDIFLEQHNLSNVIIGRYNSSEFLLALDRDSQDVEDILTNFIQNYREIQKIELDYYFSILINNDDNIERSITRLHNSIDRDNCSINKAKSKKMIL
jgi:GGDEF domain-containing protein